MIRLLSESLKYITFQNTIKHYSSSIYITNLQHAKENKLSFSEPAYLNHDILQEGPYTTTDIRKIVGIKETAEMKMVKNKENLLKKIAKMSKKRDKIIALCLNDSRKMSSACDGKPPKYREPCKSLCEDDDDANEFKREKPEDKCKKACEEWQRKKGVQQNKSICGDLKCLKEHACGLEKTTRSATCGKASRKKVESTTGTSTCGLVPNPSCKKVCEVVPEDPCVKAPRPYQYKALDPSLYLMIPKHKPRRRFSKPCGLLPASEDEMECELLRSKKRSCSLVPKPERKKVIEQKPLVQKAKCKSTKCTPCKLVHKEKPSAN